jgi:hypothetical protein
VSRVPDEGAQVAAVTDERVELTLSTTNFEKAAQIGRDLADASAARRTKPVIRAFIYLGIAIALLSSVFPKPLPVLIVGGIVALGAFGLQEEREGR